MCECVHACAVKNAGCCVVRGRKHGPTSGLSMGSALDENETHSAVDGPPAAATSAEPPAVDAREEVPARAEPRGGPHVTKPNVEASNNSKRSPRRCRCSAHACVVARGPSTPHSPV